MSPPCVLPCFCVGVVLGWGGWDVNVSCTCTHGGCDANAGAGVGWDVNDSCTCAHGGCYAVTRLRLSDGQSQMCLFC